MTADDGSAVPIEKRGSGRRPVCEGSLGAVLASDALTCRAAHRLHETHVAWTRTAIDHRPEHCYQCHTATEHRPRSVLAADVARSVMLLFLEVS